MGTRLQRGSGAALAVALGLVAGQGCSDRAAQADSPAAAVRARAARDVVLITVDALRHDAPGFSGSDQVETPWIDRLAAGGVRFRWAHAHTVVTLPSHASILTGLHPHEHGVHDNTGFSLPGELDTLATILQRRGYRTAAFVSAFPLDRRFGLDRGFDVYDDEYESHAVASFGYAERFDAQTVARARAWWEGHAGQRRFMWVHLFGPHLPYQPLEPFASRYASSPYHGEVAQADAVLQALLEPLLQAGTQAPLVVLTSDHGEALGEHGEHGHGIFAYESTLRVPLVFWAPGMLSPAATDLPARHVDLLPTVLDLLDMEAPEHVAGTSLFAAAAAAQERPCDFEVLSGWLNRGWAPLRGRIQGRTKAIRLPVAELYDLDVDPAETNNLARSQPERLRRMLSALPHADPDATVRAALDAATGERLRDLETLAAAMDAGRDPKNRIAQQEVLDQAGQRFVQGDQAGAIALLEGLLVDSPDMALAYSYLGFAYLEQERVDAAVELLQRAVAAGVADEALRVLLAHARLRAGDAPGAAQALAADAESRNPETQVALGRIAAETGDGDEARRRLERALKLDSTFPRARLELGMLHLRQRRFDLAARELERALVGLPRLAKGWNALGVARAEIGDLRSAVEAWQRAADADPGFPDPLFNLALALQRVGEAERAIPVVERYLTLVDGTRRQRAERLLRALQQQARAGR